MLEQSDRALIYKHMFSVKLQPYVYILKVSQSTVMSCLDLNVSPQLYFIYNLTDGVSPGQRLIYRSQILFYFRMYVLFTEI